MSSSARAPVAKYQKLSALNDRNLFLTVLEAEVQGAREVGVHSKTSSLGLQAGCVLMGPPSCAHVEGERTELSGVSSGKDTNPVGSGPRP